MTERISRPVISKLIRDCLEVVNSEREDGARIPLADDTPLLADDSRLDSLELVAFLTDLETRASKIVGRRLSLAADALTADSEPFRDVGRLTDYLATKLNDA